MRAALLALAAGLAPNAAAAAAPAAAGPEALECPPTLADFEREARETGSCRYRGGEAEAEAELRLEPLNLTPGQASAPEEGAALVSSPLPGWERETTYLGETPAGDLRRERWTAAANPRLSVSVEYAIPALAPAQAEAFVTQAGAANGVTPSDQGPAPGAEVCAEEIAGLALERAVGPRQAGAAVLSGCAYAGETLSALVYRPRSAELALEAFRTAAPPGAEETSAPAIADAQALVYRGEEANSGLWLRILGDGALAVEIVWSGADERVRAILEAAFG